MTDAVYINKQISEYVNHAHLTLFRRKGGATGEHLLKSIKCGNDYPVKSSDQVNAIDTTVTFKLSDDEIDDMKLSAEKALKELFAKGHPV